jgi:hypothetical protein
LVPATEADAQLPSVDIVDTETTIMSFAFAIVTVPEQDEPERLVHPLRVTV